MAVPRESASADERPRPDPGLCLSFGADDAGQPERVGGV